MQICTRMLYETESQRHVLVDSLSSISKLLPYQPDRVVHLSFPIIHDKPCQWNTHAEMQAKDPEIAGVLAGGEGLR